MNTLLEGIKLQYLLSKSVPIWTSELRSKQQLYVIYDCTPGSRVEPARVLAVSVALLSWFPAAVQSHCYHKLSPSITSTETTRSRSPWYFKAMHQLLLLPASLTGVMPECPSQGLPLFQLYVENHSKVLINFNS